MWVQGRLNNQIYKSSQPLHRPLNLHHVHCATHRSPPQHLRWLLSLSGPKSHHIVISGFHLLLKYIILCITWPVTNNFNIIKSLLIHQDTTQKTLLSNCLFRKETGECGIRGSFLKKKLCWLCLLFTIFSETRSLLTKTCGNTPACTLHSSLGQPLPGPETRWVCNSHHHHRHEEHRWRGPGSDPTPSEGSRPALEPYF